MNKRADFGARLLTWFDRHGRIDLPWQHPRTPYRVWVAEIMLQQTRVNAVVPYFRTFMARFPDIDTLATAERDEVMAHWAGLGYYARARNLQAAAQRMVAEHGGELPDNPVALQALPGIGRSTAGAILAQAFNRRAPILDGNAKRVLARHRSIEDTPGTTTFEKRLWALAEQTTPMSRPADYTQAIMDLGATVCVRRMPRCGACPVAADCLARRHNRQAELPARRRRPARPLRQARLLFIRRAPDDILLQRRPPTGIWGGLWAPPELPDGADVARFCRERLGLTTVLVSQRAALRHGFTHFELDIRPLEMRVVDSAGIMDAADCAWHPRAQPPALPAPIAKLLANMMEQPEL